VEPRWFSPRRLIQGSPVLRRVGFFVTRVLTSTPIRHTSVGRRLYTRLYLLGKRLGEAPEQLLFRDHLAPGMTVFDIGANVGFYTEISSRLVGAGGRVYAFEPDPFCSAVLRDRVREFENPNVQVETSAVGDANGTVTFYSSGRDRAESRTHPFEAGVPAKEVRVPAVTIDSYCQTHEIARVDIVKIDVEGAEVRTLQGMRRLFAASAPAGMFIEFSPTHLRGAGASSEAFWEVLAEAGYVSYVMDDEGRLNPVGDTRAFSETLTRGRTNIWAVPKPA
jgi:FkbM family methyltransferase